MVVAHVVELLVVAVDEEALVLDFVHFVDALGFELVHLLDYARAAAVEAVDERFEVLYFLGKLAAHFAQAEYFGVDGLELVEGLEALFDGAESFGFLICCHSRYR